MKQLNYLAALSAGALLTLSAHADNRLFTYTYEPETPAKGEWEYEETITSRLGRNATVGQQEYQHWLMRHEIEYAFSDRYAASLSVNQDLEHFREPGGNLVNDYSFTGIAMENRYLMLDPVNNPVGLTLYLEPTYDGENAELEQKIIIGQRHGKWKCAVNFIHATEWEDDFRETEGELEISAGVARELTSRWSLGLEIRDHNELPEYKKWENTALYLGPVISYHRRGWWAALTVMPQIFGHTFGENPDNNRHLELEGHERLNVRLMFGFDF